MRFRIVNVEPLFPRPDGLNNYSDIVDPLHWGLRQLGHEAQIIFHLASAGKVNLPKIAPGEMNIVLGAHALSPAAMQALPDNTIVYNFEDLEMTPSNQRGPAVQHIAERFRIWDFYTGNIASWREHKPKFAPVLVPYAFAPILQRVRRCETPPIDALFYGNPGAPRLETIADLARHGIRVVYACGLYGVARDELIANSKLILNLCKQNGGRMFETVRVGYALANQKPVLNEFAPHMNVEPDLQNAIAFAPREHLAAACLQLTENPAVLNALARQGFAAFSQRDIRGYLAVALAKL